MAKSYILLTPEEGKLLQRVLDWWKNQESGARKLHTTPANILATKPIYMAKIPMTGIEGITFNGTADDTPVDISGEDCEIFRVFYDSDLDSYQCQSTGFTERVFNLNLVPLFCGMAVIELDRFGRWVTDRNCDGHGVLIADCAQGDFGDVRLYNENDEDTGIVLSCLNPSMDLSADTLVNIGEMYRHLEMYPRECSDGSGGGGSGSGHTGDDDAYASSHG